MNKKIYVVAIIMILSLSLLQTGCGTSKAVQGGAIGAVAGGVLGGVVGHQVGNKVLGAIIGAAVGGTAGALIGHNMDKQAEEMRQDMQGATIERVGEGIKITFDSGILFDVDKSELRSEAKTSIENLSRILNKYEDTNILIAGHTDASGTAEHNQVLSENRAAAVANYAKGQGVSGSRFTVIGFGESQPVNSNSTVSDMQQNRRVEIAIFANEDMKDAAEDGTLQ